ncbi:hypothetical protein GCM10009682_52360 [Luedemannella flava]|uniref:Secreted protein n=1 Tax=Luedemannella flava TaxID=349316 RepID=A0ABN2MG69_9ACTN
MVVSGALGHHEHPQRLLLAVAASGAAALGADLLQLALHLPGGLLGRRLLPLHAVERRLEIAQLRGQPRVTARTGRGSTAAGSPELVVLLDESCEFALNFVEESIDLLLVVPPLTDRGLLERDVVDVSRG